MFLGKTVSCPSDVSYSGGRKDRTSIQFITQPPFSPNFVSNHCFTKIQDILFILSCVQLHTFRTVHTYTHTELRTQNSESSHIIWYVYMRNKMRHKMRHKMRLKNVIHTYVYRYTYEIVKIQDTRWFNGLFHAYNYAHIKHTVHDIWTLHNIWNLIKEVT